MLLSSVSVNAFEPVKQNVLAMLEKLNPNLTYHCVEHTLDVLEQSLRIASEEGIDNDEELFLLKIAALYHDTGFLNTYALHEKNSCELFLADADQYKLSGAQKDIIVNLIMATQIPQMPKTLLERIICDADLDYLGRNDFFSIGESLRKEFLSYKIVNNDDEWNKLQIYFLQNHNYHTPSSQKLREPKKQLNFNKLL
ncbi:HD domain-containing protein [Daejeonella oryzae]|uniref:HD domain-containing protein n=1 Tax=Daejeonella oryzae TaxID=1122943 RepID=UPI0004093682|nr:HD domain-containing protein [Daejeonella oryzae]